MTKMFVDIGIIIIPVPISVLKYNLHSQKSKFICLFYRSRRTRWNGQRILGNIL